MALNRGGGPLITGQDQLSSHDLTNTRYRSNQVEPGRPLGLGAGNIPRFGSLPVVNQIGPPKRWGTLPGRRGVKDLCSEWSATAVSPHSVLIASGSDRN